MEKIKKWLGIGQYTESDILALQSAFKAQQSEIRELTLELSRTQKFIGALYDYLEIRPQRTFVQDFSRLPEDAMPTMEVIKATKYRVGQKLQRMW